jgi:hypothetical protein
VARCVPLAAADATLAPAEGRAAADQYADQALSLLREALDNGFTNLNRLKSDPALAPLRSRADFTLLLNRLRPRKTDAPGN